MKLWGLNYETVRGFCNLLSLGIYVDVWDPCSLSSLSQLCIVISDGDKEERVDSGIYHLTLFHESWNSLKCSAVIVQCWHCSIYSHFLILFLSYLDHTFFMLLHCSEAFVISITNIKKPPYRHCKFQIFLQLCPGLISSSTLLLSTFSFPTISFSWKYPEYTMLCHTVWNPLPNI